ncbi:exonuclease domain-containing protein [Paracoccus sp. ME4]|uniref:exonuclease domain-containing protein n=1 Tax=Paracoccus sp. ME4 TaxID=3138066 RepID=UPI00398B46F1
MRIKVLDTETTGFSYDRGDRMVEIGIVELQNFRPTGRVFHEFVDPGVKVHWAAARVHGLTNQALAGKPRFAQIARNMLEFIGDDELWIHNSRFDMGFLLGELGDAGMKAELRSRDTVRIVSRKLEGSVKLDQVVARLGLCIPDRSLHGALLDAAILAGVLARLHHAPDIDIAALCARGKETEVDRLPPTRSPYPVQARPRPIDPSEAEMARKAARLRATIRSLIDQAASFQALMRDIEAAGIRVRPSVNGDGSLVGFRYRHDGIWARSGTLGIRMDEFADGRLRYAGAGRERELLEEMQRRYDRDHGPVDGETWTEIRPGRIPAAA